MDRVSSSSSCSSSSSSESSPTSVIEAPLPPIHSSAINPDISVSHLEEFADTSLSPRSDVNHNDSTVSISINSMIEEKEKHFLLKLTFSLGI